MSAKTVKRRRSEILALLSDRKIIRTSELESMLGVSNETIRKDIAVLQEQGIVVRHHGQVELCVHNDEQKLDFRTNLNLPQKERIASAALELMDVQEGDIIGLDVGSTTLCLAKLMRQRRNQTIITNDMRIADALVGSDPTNNVYCAGGLLRPFDKALYGPWTLKCLRSVRMRVAVLGSCGARNWNGIGAVSFEDADVKNAYVKNSERAIALLDSSKFSANALLEAVAWEKLYAVITDEGILPEQRQCIERKTRLIIA